MQKKRIKIDLKYEKMLKIMNNLEKILENELKIGLKCEKCLENHRDLGKKCPQTNIKCTILDSKS